MIYEEKNKFNTGFICLALCLLAFFFAPVMLNIQQLLSDEGFFLASVREMNQMPPVMRAHGDIVSGGYPLYPIFVKLLTGLGLPMIVALRLIPCLCLFGISAIIFLTAWKAKGLTAGIVGFSAMMINFVSIEKFSNGNAVLLGTLCVFSSWMVWFALGIWQNKWKMTWIFSFLLLGLTFYSIGFFGLILVIFPMLFHRRPLTVWMKPRGLAFAAGLVILAFFILLWGIPRWTAENVPSLQRNSTDLPSIGEYILHLLTFPLDAAIRFFPWILFAWAPFCPAIVPLDDNPLLSRYLRTLFLGTFAILWISPLTQGRDIFYLLPPLSVLVALNYWIVVRRYGWKILKIFQLLAIGLLVLSSLTFGYLLMKDFSYISVIFPALHDAVKPLIDHKEYWNLAVIGSGLGTFFSLLAVLECVRGTRVWLVIVIFSGAMIIPFRCVVIPYQNLNLKRAEVGRAFRKAIPENETPDLVYRMYDIPPFYGEMFYFGITLKTIASPDGLPNDKPVVYVFSRVVPSAPERTWKLVHRGFHRESEIELWRGKLKTEDDYE